MEVLESVARQSKVLKEMLDTCVTLQPPDENSISMDTGFATGLRKEVEEEVPLPTIHSDHLKIVVRSEHSLQSGEMLLEKMHICINIVYCRNFCIMQLKAWTDR